MVSLDNSVIAKIKRGNKEFEILVDSDLVWEYKNKTINDISKILASDYIFEKSIGNKVSDQDLKKVFDTTNIYDIAKLIVMNGEIQLTSNQRKKIIEKKRNEVITYIVKNSIDPQTKTPHPRKRIEIAMEESKVNIDPSKSTEELILNTLKSIKLKIPIKIEEVKLLIKISPLFSSKVIEKCIKYNKNIDKKWSKDGGLELGISIPHGIKNELINEVNKITKGNNEIKII